MHRGGRTWKNYPPYIIILYVCACSFLLTLIHNNNVRVVKIRICVRGKHDTGKLHSSYGCLWLHIHHNNIMIMVCGQWLLCYGSRLSNYYYTIISCERGIMYYTCIESIYRAQRDFHIMFIRVQEV